MISSGMPGLPSWGRLGLPLGRLGSSRNNLLYGGIKLRFGSLACGSGLRAGSVLQRQGRGGAVAAALVTGDRSAISRDTLSAMRDSGLAHLLAISGLHMGLVAAILFFGLRTLLALSERLALFYPIKKWAAAAALVGGFAYLVLTGGTIPTQRAFLMTGLVLVAVFLDRTAISMRLVAWAAAGILLIAPESLLSASFQMSFAAVVAFVAVYEDRGRLFGTSGAGGPPAGSASPLATS